MQLGANLLDHPLDLVSDVWYSEDRMLVDVLPNMLPIIFIIRHIAKYPIRCRTYPFCQNIPHGSDPLHSVDHQPPTNGQLAKDIVSVKL